MNEVKKKRRFLAPIFMLSAGAISSIAMFAMGYELQRMLLILLVVLLLFYVLGAFLSYMIGRFEAQNEAERAAQLAEEGEVIEKEAEDEGAEDGVDPDAAYMQAAELSDTDDEN